MKLSMAIIEHWLSSYKPVSIIYSQDATITDIRLFSYDKLPDNNYLYVGRSRDFFDNSQSNEVLLVHQKDVISLNTQELEDVFDTLRDALIFYQNWEKNMMEASMHENPEQTLIDSCAAVFGPMFFADQSLQITAFSRQYPIGSVNQNWDDFWKLGTLSSNSILRIQKGKYMEKFSEKWDCEVFYEDTVEAYPYSMMITQENSAHQITGQMTIVSESPFPEYQVHLAQFLKQALCFISDFKLSGDFISAKQLSKKQISEKQISVAQSLFQDILCGKNLSDSNIQNFYQIQGWDKKQYFKVLLLRGEQIPPTTYIYYMKMLRRYFPDCLFCAGMSGPNLREEGIICCVPLKKTLHERSSKVKSLPENDSNSNVSTDTENCFEPDDSTDTGNCFVPNDSMDTEKRLGPDDSTGGLKNVKIDIVENLCQFSGRIQLESYCSYSFQGIEYLPEMYRQVLTCYKRQKHNYYDCALEDLASLNSNIQTRKMALHPAVRQILLYDKEKKTSFYEMLEMYLRCERNRGMTAQNLFLHKNTLVYRIEKAERIFHLHLENAYEREYLQLSFRCTDIAGHDICMEPLISD